MDEEKVVNEQEEVKQEEHAEKKQKKVSLKEYQDLQEQFNKALATAAHHQNLSKYYQGEYDKMLKYKSQNLIEEMLPSIDAFELAFKYKAPTVEAENYKAGFEYIYKMFMTVLENEGLSTITPKVNDEFDGSIMQVVDTVATSEEELFNKVESVMLNGYKLKDRLIRPATVKIYVKEENKDCEKEAKN